MFDLSILIPARNEMFIGRTIEDILEKIEGKTEVIAVLDGYTTPIPEIPTDPRVKILKYDTSIGQRAATNRACEQSTAKYVMKIDAHCAFDQGFDVKMLEAIKGHDNWTMSPLMKNLHAFDWKCKKCGNRWYQAPTPLECLMPDGTTKNTKCDSREFERVIVWQGKRSPNSVSYCFDSEPHFQYFGEFSKRPEGQGDITPSMSLQGSCFMLTSDKYWELKICDEEFGSWGSQGIEVAVKTWLSGGQVMINHKTWYAHMFRTRGGDFGFPYPQNSSGKAKKTARDLFFYNKWEKQIHPLHWLVEKFWPVKGWTDEDLMRLKLGNNKGIIYYSDNQLDPVIMEACQKQILKSGLPVVSATLKKTNFGKNIHFPTLKRGSYALFKQILAALEHSSEEIIFFCEHDVFYHPSHFEFTPTETDVFYFNNEVEKVDWFTGKSVRVDKCEQLSGLCVFRETALKWVREKMQQLETNGFDGHYEPRGIRKSFRSKEPNIDIRHDKNQTPTKWSPDQFRNPENAKGWTEGTCPEWAIDEIPWPFKVA